MLETVKSIFMAQSGLPEQVISIAVGIGIVVAVLSLGASVIKRFAPFLLVIAAVLIFRGIVSIDVIASWFTSAFDWLANWIIHTVPIR